MSSRSKRREMEELSIGPVPIERSKASLITTCQLSARNLKKWASVSNRNNRHGNLRYVVKRDGSPRSLIGIKQGEVDAVTD